MDNRKTPTEEALGLQEGELYGLDEVPLTILPDRTINGYTVEFTQNEETSSIEAWVKGIGVVGRGYSMKECLDDITKRGKLTSTTARVANTMIDYPDTSDIEALGLTYPYEIDMPYSGVASSSVRKAANKLGLFADDTVTFSSVDDIVDVFTQLYNDAEKFLDTVWDADREDPRLADVHAGAKYLAKMLGLKFNGLSTTARIRRVANVLKNILKKIAARVMEELTVCQDCYIYIANGDLSALDNLPPEEADARAKEVEEGCAKYAPNHLVAGDDISDFSRSPCDCCGTRLAGPRFSAIVLGD